MSGSKEARCARCIHLNVCKLKDTFLTAQEEVDKVTLYSSVTDNGEQKITKVWDIPWITIPLLICKHYAENLELTHFRKDESIKIKE